MGADQGGNPTVVVLGVLQKDQGERKVVAQMVVVQMVVAQ